jgi:adenine-specific DNA-methyltransferase
MHKSERLRGIAQAWTRRFPGQHLLVFAVASPTGFDQITFVNARRLGEGAQVRIKLHKLIVDRRNPTRHDLDTLNAIAAFPIPPLAGGQGGRETAGQGDSGTAGQGGVAIADTLYAAQCAAFDVERLTNEFYREYTRRFRLIQERIKRDNPAIAAFYEDERLHTFTQRLFGRLMFLYFLQKKGALNGRPDFITHWYDEAARQQENLYRSILEPLFFQTLNQPRDGNRSPIFGRVPYLNGGLFAQDEDDHAGEVYLDNEIFDAHSIDGLLYFLNAHNFTIEEDTPLEVEVALDPEMLGKVFENLLEAEERGQSGTFYTPRAVVSFMCREALAAYLARETGLDTDRLNWLLDEAETGEPASPPRVGGAERSERETPPRVGGAGGVPP